jgi:DNA-binding GntR family transcriptional regulator
VTLHDRREPIARRPLAEELADRLREMIVEGELPPGERISEKALCDRFGVSRTPLREALKVLSREGLVTLTPNRGAAVAALTIADLEEAFPIMAALEALTGELAAKRAADAEVAAVAALADSMEAAWRGKDRARYLTLNDEFHAALSEAARNPTLAEMKRALDRRIRRGRRRASVSEARWAEAIAEHREIAEALAARDAGRLSALLRRHMQNKLAALRAMAPPPDDPSPEDA